MGLRFSPLGCVSNGKLPFSFCNKVSRFILIGVRMTPYNNWLIPCIHQTRNIAHNNRFTKYCSAQDITDCPVRRLPHFFQTELLYTSLIRSDCSTLDSYIIFLSCLSTVYRHLIVCRITVFYTQVKIFEIYIHIREYQLIFYIFPYNTGHFVPIHLHNGIRHFYLLHIDIYLSDIIIYFACISFSHICSKVSICV